MKSTSLKMALFAGIAGVAAIADPPMLDPYYRIDRNGDPLRYTRIKQRSARNFDVEKRRARNKAAKASRARNRK